MKRQLIRLTENDLHNIIKESVKNALNELDNSTVASAMKKMRDKGAPERANHLGDLAVNNYGGKELADAGYTSHETSNGGALTLGANEPAYVRNRQGWKANDAMYDKEKAEYDSRGRIGKMFHKEPTKPVDYGKEDYRQKGHEFTPKRVRTSDRRVARQATNFMNNNNGLMDKYKSNDFLK